MKIAFYTLGCKVNQNETGALAQLFAENGFFPVEEGQQADVYIVNSCTVTAGGDKKSLQWLRRAKRENPDAVTVLTGCFPQAFPEDALKAQEADVITGSNQRRRVLEGVLRFLETHEQVVDIAPHGKKDAFEELPMEHFKGHTRAFVKIEDGCNRRCAYCVIPRARGNVRSRSQESILKELRKLAAVGHREVVFTGINLSSYGKDTGTNLADIIEAAATVDGIERIRLGSLEPDLLDDACLMRMSKVKQLCPQFHLALQSGCDATLRRMRRVYSTQQFCHVAAEIRRLFPTASLTTDIIVGFPAETTEEFAQSLAFVTQMRFLKVHVFGFSRREGTPAYTMPDQILEAEKAARSKQMQAAADAVRKEIIDALGGTQVEVLLETPINATAFTGYTKEYIPVLIAAKGHASGEIVLAQLGAFDGERCVATLV